MAHGHVFASRALRRRLAAWALAAVLLAGCQPLTPSLPALPPHGATPTPSAAPGPVLTAPAIAADPTAWALADCQSCHGALAEGDRAPALRGTALDAASFLAAVRGGRPGMRPYSVAELSDSRVGQMHAWLQSLSPAAPTPLPNAFGLTVPPGVVVERFAADLERPAGLAFGPDGALYVAEHGVTATGGQVWRLADDDGDGQAEQRTLVAAGLARPTALLWLTQPAAPPVLLIGGQDSLVAWVPGEAAPRRLALDWPDVPTFVINDLALGVDGFVYLAQGSPWPLPGSAPPQPGAIWRLPAEALLSPGAAVTPELFAFGMRSPFGLAFSPSGAIYSVDSGIGWPAAPDVPDELNLLLGGGDYGWPATWGRSAAESGAIGPMATFPAGAGASDLLFYSGRQWREYANDVILTYAGQPGAGSASLAQAAPRLVRVEIVSDVGGYHDYVHEFIGGLQRPLGLAEDGAGALYVADYDAGAIYRFRGA